MKRASIRRAAAATPESGQEDRGERHREARQLRRSERVAVVRREQQRAAEALAVAAEDLYRLRLGIDDPVLGHAGAVVEVALLHLVVAAVRGRKDLDHQVGSAGDARGAD